MGPTLLCPEVPKPGQTSFFPIQQQPHGSLLVSVWTWASSVGLGWISSCYNCTGNPSVPDGLLPTTPATGHRGQGAQLGPWPGCMERERGYKVLERALRQTAWLQRAMGSSSPSLCLEQKRSVTLSNPSPSGLGLFLGEFLLEKWELKKE